MPEHRSSTRRSASTGSDGGTFEGYEKKRDFGVTPEPPPQPIPAREGPLVFVVQKHAAKTTHYDFRLELDGVLKSWAVPKGPSTDPAEKRLAVQVEDHPLEYRSFEGTIPEGQYGAGHVFIWDAGDYSPEDDAGPYFDDRRKAEELLRHALADGKVSLVMRGRKMKGRWTLVKTRRKNDWLLIKHPEESAQSSVGSAETGQDELPVKDAGVNVPSAGLDEIQGARRAPFPTSLVPMLASSIDVSYSGPDWIYEPKLDGFRVISFVRYGKSRLVSRRGIDVSGEYPGVAGELGFQPASQIVLDGEIVALDEKQRPSFQRLQRARLDAGKHGGGGLHIVYYVFDIMHLDGYDLQQAALGWRKALLQRILVPTSHVRAVDYFERDPEAVFKAATAYGLEGIIAKNRYSTYQSGQRSRDWIKVKSSRTGDFLITGYTEGNRSRRRTFGALLLGHYDAGGKLVFDGHVGSGFDDETLTRLRKRLDGIRREECPHAEEPPQHAPTTWVEPELVAEVRFAERTRDGYLRAPVFLRIRDDKPPADVREVTELASSRQPVSNAASGLERKTESVLEQLENPREAFGLKVDDYEIQVSNLYKQLWPAAAGNHPLTKRDLLLYLARVSPCILPHLRDRPLTLSRYPDGIGGEHFFQKHWPDRLPEFVETAQLYSEKGAGSKEYLICNNLATLLWLGQMANIEFHTWFSRGVPESDGEGPPLGDSPNEVVDYPDFIIFDLDPYIYSGDEPKGAEPELNREGFARTCEIAVQLKSILDGLKLASYVKTSGRTGLHVYVPVVRRFEYDAVRSAAETIGRFLLQHRRNDVSMEWAVEKRTGKVFLDHNQNVRGKTLACAYSPRPTPEATVSMPLSWDEVGGKYPTDFTIVTAAERLAQVGDLWADILEKKGDLETLLER